jgi:hypothetical protein
MNPPAAVKTAAAPSAKAVAIAEDGAEDGDQHEQPQAAADLLQCLE